MPIYIYLAALAVTLSAPLVLWAIGGIRPHRNVSTNRLQTAETDLRQVVLTRPTSERVVAPAIEAIARRGRRLTPVGARDSIERRINQAGFAGKLTLDKVVVAKLALSCVVGGFALLVWFVDPSAIRLIVAVVLTVVVWFLPDLILYGRAAERQQRIGEELPEMLDQMTVTVEAGLGFEAALARVVAEGGTAVSEEFGRALQDIRLGVSREQALTRVIERNTSADLKHFVLALTQAERLGVPLANVLRVLSDEMRERRRVQAQERATKVPAKLVFPLVLCIMPSLFVAILGPSLIRLFDGGLL